MTAELYPDIAPQTVDRVLTLVDQKLYDGVIFHRVINDFMIQTGGYIPSEQGLMQLSAPGFFGEFNANGFTNELKHEPGVLSMARANSYNSASTQFFICTAQNPKLDGGYAAFGKLVDETGLTRKAIIAILQGIRSDVFGQFKENPEEFIAKAGQLINEQKATAITFSVKAVAFCLKNIICPKCCPDNSSAQQTIFPDNPPQGFARSLRHCRYSADG